MARDAAGEGRERLEGRTSRSSLRASGRSADSRSPRSGPRRYRRSRCCAWSGRRRGRAGCAGRTTRSRRARVRRRTGCRPGSRSREAPGRCAGSCRGAARGSALPPSGRGPVHRRRSRCRDARPGRRPSGRRGAPGWARGSGGSCGLSPGPRPAGRRRCAGTGPRPGRRPVGVGDVEHAGALVVGGEREGRHPRLPPHAVRLDPVRDVQEGAPQQTLVRDHADRAGRLRDEEPLSLPRRLGQEDGVLEPGDAVGGDELRPEFTGRLAVRDADDARADGDEGSDDAFRSGGDLLSALGSAPANEPVYRSVQRGGVEGAVSPLAE